MYVESVRHYYQMRLGKQISDTHWTRVKNRLAEAGLELSEVNINSYLELSKHLPRYRNSFKLLGIKLKTFADYLQTSPNLTGLHFQYYLKSQNINPTQPTVSRWFQPVGGYRKNRIYNSKELAIIAIPAFIYQIKKEHSNA
ncbi:MAG: hypothetical protein PUP93_28560 [Rhizonema sp. NSF051]|nr:hypothetical protein [Rhizonema sp. NSF051]